LSNGNEAIINASKSAQINCKLPEYHWENTIGELGSYQSEGKRQKKVLNVNLTLKTHNSSKLIAFFEL
jgi:hypothetical protein